MTLLHPLWLAAYPALLLLWWIRPRGGRPRQVAALFLWEGAAAGRRGRRLAVQPGGVRVPLLLALLCLCLAAPQDRPADRGPAPPVAGVVCDDALPPTLRSYLADLGAPCVATSPWAVEVRPGAGAGTVRWAVDDPLLAGAPATATPATDLRTLEAEEWDRILARASNGPVCLLRPTGDGGRLVIGADLTAPGLRDSVALPLLLAAWVETIHGEPPPPPRRPAPRWRWVVAAALLLLWLPWPRHPRWAAAATLPLGAALLLPGGGARAVVLDISPSCGTNDLATAAAEAMAGARRVAVVAAAADAEVWVEAGSTPSRAAAELGRQLAAPRPASRATALAAAVARGAALAPEVVVVSDGRAAPADAPPGVRVHCRLLPSPALTLHLPNRLPEGGTAVAVARVSGVAEAARVDWRIDGEAAGESAVVAGEARLAVALPTGRHRVEAAVAGLPPVAGLVEVAGPPRVAVVGDTAFARIAGVEEVATAGLPRRLATNPPAALVVAGDLPAGRGVREAIARQVAAGMGLLVVGLPELATPDDPMTPLLPLRPGPEGGRPPVAVVVVLDRSGSMAEGGAPLDLGVAAAVAVRLGLGPEDRWGLIAFDRDVHLLDPLGPPPPVAALRHRLARLTSSGGTDPWRAVAAARDLLALAPGEREIVLITDGRVALPKTPPPAGVRITAIQVGARPPEARLARLCRATGGRLLHAATAAELPAALLRQPPEAAEEEGPFRLLPAAADAPFPLPTHRTVARRRPAHIAADGRPLLLAGGDPILAIGRHGLGRIAQWTAPAADLADPPTLLHPLLAWLAPRPGGVETTLANDHLWVAIPAAAAGSAPPRCRLRSPTGSERHLSLQQVAGGWSGETELEVGGAWAVEVRTASGAEVRRIVEVGEPEWAISPAAGKARLTRLSRATGGRLLAPGEPPPPPPATPAPPLLPLLLAALCLLLSPRAASGHRD